MSCCAPGVRSRISPCPVSPPLGASSPERPTRCGTPPAVDARGRPKPVARPRKARQPKGNVTPGVRLRYRGAPPSRPPPLPVFIDPHTRFAVAFAAATPSSRQATLALDALCHLLPAPPRFVLSDNGSEFLGHQRLEERGITHWWTYPRSPKMNAHAERFNRTLQEQFVDYHEDLLFDDLADFNRKLADWLLFYNTERPHHSLRLHSPVQFLIQHQPECQRWWILLSSGKKCATVSCSKKVTCVEVQGRGHLLIEVAIGNLIES